MKLSITLFVTAMATIGQTNGQTPVGNYVGAVTQNTADFVNGITDSTVPNVGDVVVPDVGNVVPNVVGSIFKDTNDTDIEDIIIDFEDNVMASVSGTDGKPNCLSDGSGDAWEMSATISEDFIVVDFSPRGGPENLAGELTAVGIAWDDGNTWRKITDSDGFFGEYADPNHMNCKRTIGAVVETVDDADTDTDIEIVVNDIEDNVTTSIGVEEPDNEQLTDTEMGNGNDVGDGTEAVDESTESTESSAFALGTTAFAAVVVGAATLF